jgi:hypothetical protein
MYTELDFGLVLISILIHKDSRMTHMLPLQLQVAVILVAILKIEYCILNMLEIINDTVLRMIDDSAHSNATSTVVLL